MQTESVMTISRRAVTLTITIPVPDARRLFHLPTRMLNRVWDTLVLWQTRALERRCLLEMDDRLRRDAGLSRDDVRAEARKPFWRP